MSDYIKREDATGIFVTAKEQVYTIDEVVEMLASADVAPVRHGRWVERYKSDAPPTLKERWICSCCGNVQTYGTTDYCPNCGAKMDEDNK